LIFNLKPMVNNNSYMPISARTSKDLLNFMPSACKTKHLARKPRGGILIFLAKKPQAKAMNTQI
jgi:hypothetical protein